LIAQIEVTGTRHTRRQKEVSEEHRISTKMRAVLKVRRYKIAKNANREALSRHKGKMQIFKNRRSPDPETMTEIWQTHA
jgi:hypothetical protein